MVASDEIINMESNNIDDRMGKILLIFEFGEEGSKHHEFPYM